MTRSLLVLMLIFFANIAASQNDNYSKLWSEVEQFENQGLPKSALKVVQTIESKARSANHSSQIVKVLLFKSKLSLTLEEDAQLKIITDFKTEIDKSATPTKNLLQNVLANLYWQYFQQNRYKFYNRTKTESKVDPSDFRTWDLQTLFSEIHTYFDASLQNGLILQKTSLDPFDVIINKGEGSKLFRPTLYDFLSHNALNFYVTKEYNITKPAYKFEINDTNYLSNAKDYSTLQLISKDTASLEFKALKIYQDLIAFHLKDKNPIALTDVNIQRLKFVYENGRFTNKDKLLENAFKTESEAYDSNEVSALYNFELATLYTTQGNNYSTKKDAAIQWKLKEAIALCDRAITKFPESIGAKKCQRLKSQIEAPSLSIQSEAFLPIQKKAKLLLTYKNINALSFSIYKLSNDEYQNFIKIYRENEKEAFIEKLSVEKNWKTTLKNENDYQQHASEILISELLGGRYLITGKSLDLDTNFFAYTTIQITDIAVVEYNNGEKKQFQLINRNSGEPIANAKVKLHFKSRNKTNTEQKTSDLKGIITLSKVKERHYNLSMEVNHKNDTAYFDNYYLRNYYSNQEKTNSYYNSFLFTDRSIYRPGQTLYFKSILMKTEDNTSQVIANEKCEVILYNTNGETIKNQTFKTNEYGSIHGEFILPNGGLMGDYRIELKGEANYRSSSYFSVEEYKRPKFETKFKPVTETYKINDVITLKGEALAFAGSNITDAKVVYRVTRKVNYPHWYYWSRPNFFSEPQEIAHGETVTNNKGSFEIDFKAIPDQSVDKKGLPVFKYEVTADVTDINGETRSATTIVNVGYHALTAKITINETLDKTKKDHEIAIGTKNLNDEFVPATGVIKIYKLKAPKTVLRKRPWAAPDYQTYSETQFKAHFPHDAYKNEDQPENWEKGDLVFNETFDTNKSKTLKLGTIKKWYSGRYIVVLEGKDQFGQLVKDEAQTTLFKDVELFDNELFTIRASQDSYKPGDNAELTLGSSAETLFVTVVVEKDNKVIDEQIIKLNKNTKSISVPVTKDDVGGFVVHYSFSAFNGFNGGALPINVPYEKTNLEIETLTFRDRLKPGTDETWTFKIKGPKSDQVSAELLASMYDASLDQFKPHSWQFNPIQKPIYRSRTNRDAQRSFSINSFSVHRKNQNNYYEQPQQYDQLNWFGLYLGGGGNYAMKSRRRMGVGIEAAPMSIQVVEDNLELEESAVSSNAAYYGASLADSKNSSTNKDAFDEEETNTNKKESKSTAVQIRKNLQETAFFFPQLQTDKDGTVSFSFTTPEALTKWNLQLLAHTKSLESTTKSLETVTQKELMVIPNAPRFLREGDQIKISTKIANLSNKNLSGTATLQLFDALTGEDISKKLLSSSNNSLPQGEIPEAERKFNVDANGNTQATWQLTIPQNIQAVQYKIIAKSNTFSDGEQNALPVLTNRMLVTETLPMWVKSNETRTFTLDKLKNLTSATLSNQSGALSNQSGTLSNHKLTLEITSNPAWYAVQALPYLMEYPHDCNEQTFSRYYANALASHIANSNPRIQNVFNQWASQNALVSNLEKNEELKSILIQETPWLRDAQSESEQKKRIALLFDLNKMTNELAAANRKLVNSQMSSGAWSWFNGGRENRYITQHIITGFGHLNKLNVKTDQNTKMIEKAIRYLDNQFIKEYKDITKYDAKTDLTTNHLSHTQLHYLYMRSFFPQIKKSKEVNEIITYYHTQIKKYWLSRSLYAKGMMTLITRRLNDNTTASKILRSLKETSITSEELGMYWKENANSWYWYQAPIETQSLLIEAFSEIQKDTNTIDNLKIWLLKNKQTNRWKTTKATTDAVYALLLQGSDWLSVTDAVDVTIGNKTIEPKKLEAVKVEAGTGYYKTSWNTSEIKPEMASVEITKKGKGIAWGGLYWQYFEDLDKITSAETPLKLKKQLFLKSNTDKGEEITPITENTALKVGDLVRVRIELRNDRVMEFVHMKDMRAAGLEPINVLSQYKWQDGLGYYESTKDAATNFFFDYLPKGVFVFEYDLRVNNAGNMSNGITTIQSMYAPEFSSHSEGIRIKVD